MEKLFAKAADKILTGLAKSLAKTGCWVFCHREEAPDELL
jgi:cyclic lactone autoinducer peptide